MSAHPEEHHVVGIHCLHRHDQVPIIQNLLTSYGKNITTRVGIHDPKTEDVDKGLIILELNNGDAATELQAKLAEVEGVDCKRMSFAHPY